MSECEGKVLHRDRKAGGRIVYEEWTLSTAENFKENKKKFCKGVSEVRKGESLRPLSIRNSRVRS